MPVKTLAGSHRKRALARSPALLACAFVAALAAPAPAQEPAPEEGSPLPEQTEPAVAPASAEPPAAEPEPEPAPPAPASSSSEPSLLADTGSSDAEAEALAAALAASSSDEPVTDPGAIDFFGFADFTFAQPLKSGEFVYPFESFAVGNLNAYVGSALGDDWRWLSEVRFMYLPHGSVPAALVFSGAPRTNTSVTDYANYSRPVRWGSISIERAWLEREFHPLLNVRLGHFLSPYGIWNVDHGTPVIIPVVRPYVVGEALIPEHQTGIEVYGTWTDGGTQLGYHLTLSNGRGPFDTYQDLDHNRALGARLFVRQDVGIGSVTFGASGYRGNYTERHDQLGTNASGGFVTEYPIDQQYRELSLAMDLKWEWQGLLVQAEAMVNDAAYTRGHRPVDPNQAIFPGPPGLTADWRRYGYYGLVGYRTPFWGIMPYVFVEDYHSADSTAVAAVNAGLNIRSTPRVVLKAEFLHVWGYEGYVSSFEPGSQLFFQATWSF
jgi:hypothetical protein